MDIAVKYRIISEIINTKDEELLNRIKSLLKIDDEDFWSDLSPEDQAAINEGIEQLDKGQYVSHESLKEEIKNRFNF
ncbi:hypothetical protein [Roseivirga pacifica]|nr:hypothetical protein [Roseivirga pacifica]MCO6358047.1 hypothetical protein [Roseivirga pacifica]MCO6366485.1 hypothetical protein [Roseivirga pacifica]MCO6370970.1 hypothetical protein [Roseivirga pacifica]MCO6373778.1 hypothetical protein [Roseivirga pacifica]MCO6380759.1 hypothetical protein [Roseivirga pacifica]